MLSMTIGKKVNVRDKRKKKVTLLFRNPTARYLAVGSFIDIFDRTSVVNICMKERNQFVIHVFFSLNDIYTYFFGTDIL
jgi:hypothetical protein